MKHLLLHLSLLLFAFASTANTQTITVPNASFNPILIDGQMSVDEWNDAETITINDTIQMLVKEMLGHVFIAFKFSDRQARPVDLFLEMPGEPIHQLHSSMQIGERVLEDTTGTNEEPAWRWGNHTDWIASESKIDPLLSRELSFDQRLYPSDGVEYQIRRSRFKGDQWRVRVEISSFTGSESMVEFPKYSERKHTENWLILDFEGT